MEIREIINKLEDATVKNVLCDFLEKYTTPAFGALPKKEVELLVLDIFEGINAIESSPGLYEFVSKLKVTRSKARNLIYERELRKATESDLDYKIKNILKKPLLQKNGDLFVLEIENPLISDHLRSKVQKLGYVTDGSFSPSIVKLNLDAIIALVTSFLSEDEQLKVKDALIEAGVPDTSLKGLLKSALKKIASKVAADAGEAVMNEASEYISPIIDGSIDAIKEKIGSLFE